LYSHSAGSVKIRRLSPPVAAVVLVGGAIGDETGEVCCRCCDDEDAVDDDDDDDDDDDEKGEEEEEEEEEVMASISLVIARITTGPGLDGRRDSGGVDAAREEEDCRCCHPPIMSACQSSNRMSGLKSSTGLSRVERRRSAGREDRGGAVVAASVDPPVRADPAVPAGGENATTPLDASRNGSAATENRAMIHPREGLGVY
jgi:hypothetical protein